MPAKLFPSSPLPLLSSPPPLSSSPTSSPSSSPPSSFSEPSFLSSPPRELAAQSKHCLDYQTLPPFPYGPVDHCTTFGGTGGRALQKSAGPTPPVMSITSLSDGQLTPTETDTDFLSHTQHLDDLWPTAQDAAEMAIMLTGRATPLSWDRKTLKRLPRGVRPVRLIGEGAANAVFELAFPEGHPAAKEFKGWLLRVAKAPANGEPARFNYLKQQEFYVNSVQSMLKKHVIKQELVVLRSSYVVQELNSFLRRVDPQRKAKFRGSFVAETNWGLLVEDMRIPDPRQGILIEFKPKWLLQSPSAPSDAIRCRQCAMELYNFIKDPNLTRKTPESKHCPLVLDNPEAPLDINLPFRLAPHLSQKDRDMLPRLTAIANHQVIRDLREVQQATDPNGPLNASMNDPLFMLAMTIRDCTCFAQIRFDDHLEGSLRLRLGDFDLKDVNTKFDRWQGAERDLISSGCYTADWILCDGKYYHPPTKCLLEWKRRAQGHPLRIINIQDKSGAPNAKSEEWHAPLSELDSRGALCNVTSNPAVLKLVLQRFSKESPKINTCPYRVEPIAPRAQKP